LSEYTLNPKEQAFIKKAAIEFLKAPQVIDINVTIQCFAKLYVAGATGALKS
jgi:hypothetical protein